MKDICCSLSEHNGGPLLGLLSEHNGDPLLGLFSEHNGYPLLGMEAKEERVQERESPRGHQFPAVVF